jgi:hypothetical protein
MQIYGHMLLFGYSKVGMHREKIGMIIPYQLWNFDNPL